MKRIKNADINFKLNPKRINLKSFSMRFYTVNSKAYFFIKDQDNVVSVEREATIYDDPEVIISGGTVAVDYYLPLDWSDLVQLGEGVLNYRCINNIDDPFFPDLVYNQVVEDTTAYYIDSDIHIDPAEDDKNLIERVVELESNLAVETADREDADVFLSGAVDTEIARAISAETELSERIDEIESGASEALDAEIERAISAETALQDAIDDEEARAIAIENAIRQDLTDESEIRSSADTAMWTAINDEIVRSTSAETAIENKVDVETLRAIGVENAISGDLQTYKATNNAALQAETTRATSAETALQSAISDEATARANADTALQTAITNEVSRAREAESGITNSLNAEVTRATAAENALDDKIDAETTRATGAEAALDVKIGTVSGNVITETTRATTAENALSGAIDSISAATSGSVEELDAKIDTVSGNVITEEARAKGVENALSGAIDTLDVRFFDDAKYEDSGNTKVINFYNGNVVKATIDCTDFLVDGMIDDVRIETISGVTYLVIDFNTASGKEDIKIPLTDIFNPANYYTKSETSGATEIANALAEKLAISDFNVYSGAVDTAINSKAAQSDLDALSGTVTGHISDNTIHLTSGDVQSQINNSISGKADSSDVYLKSETSGATELATAFAAKQNQLVAGENIIISGNVISSEGGGCEVEETVIYDRITVGYYDYDGNNNLTYAIIDYLGDKTTADSIGIFFEIGNTSDSYNSWVYFDYVNHSANTESLSDYVTAEYISDVQDFKVSVASAYQSTCWIKQIGGLQYDRNVLIPFYTINSGSPCTVISTDVVGLVEKVKDKAYEALSDCTLQTSEDKMSLGTYRINGGSGISEIKLEELDGSSNKLKPNIQVPLGVSGWTEMTFDGTCYAVGNPKSPIIRLSGGTNSLDAFNTQWEVYLDHYGNNYDSVTWNGSEFVLNSNWFGENGQFGTATVTYDDANNTLTIAYPLTAQVGDYTDNVVMRQIYSQSCQFGTAITKLEYYGEFYQPLKPFVQQLRTDVNTISGQVATKQDTLIAGSNITISGNVISATGGGGGSSYTAGDGIDITNDVISVTGKVDTLTYNTYTAATDAALASKQTTLTAGTGIDITSNVISVTGGTGGGISSAECQTMIESATTPIYQTIEDNEEVTAQALNVLNGELANKLDVSAYTPVDLSNYYTKSETSGATEIANAFAATQPKLSAGTGISIDANNVISTTGGGSITIDPSLDSGSTNAVANSAITTAINTVSGDSVCDCRDIPNVESGDSEILTVFETNSGGVLPNGIYRRFRMPLYIDTTDDYRLKLAINTAVTSASTDSQVPSAKAVYDALGSAGGGISSAECQTMIDQSISGKTNQSDFTGHTTNTSIHVTTAQTAAWDAKSDFSGSYNDLTDKPTIPTVPTSNTAFTNDAGYITANDITGKTDVTAFTAHTGDSTIHVTSSDKTSWNGAVTALGGLSLVKLTQAQYDALATKDNNTLYVIVG